MVVVVVVVVVLLVVVMVVFVVLVVVVVVVVGLLSVATMMDMMIAMGLPRGLFVGAWDTAVVIVMVVLMATICGAVGGNDRDCDCIEDGGGSRLIRSLGRHWTTRSSTVAAAIRQTSRRWHWMVVVVIIVESVDTMLVVWGIGLCGIGGWGGWDV